MFAFADFLASPKPPVFTTDPIRPDLLTDELSVFLSPIEMGAQPDLDYIIQKLVAP
jgi:hypothetical protein